MNYRHASRKLRKLEEDPDYYGGFAANIVRAFRMRVQLIREAADERDFYALKSLHYEKLKGDRKHQRSMRLNDQFRLVLTIEKGQRGDTIVIVDIEDYH
jgi:proteic killer suppression protein